MERRDSLAEDRTRLAVDRTLLAWWRTALASYGIGIVVARALSLPRFEAGLARWVGVGFVLVGILVVIAGSVDASRAYRASVGRRPPATATALTGVFLLIGLACIALTAPV